jgi:hypothetical protein
MEPDPSYSPLRLVISGFDRSRESAILVSSSVHSHTEGVCFTASRDFPRQLFRAQKGKLQGCFVLCPLNGSGLIAPRVCSLNPARRLNFERI